MSGAYLFPIPEEKLLKRFTPAFEKVSLGHSATLVALPHTGRTSHLRFILSQESVLKKLGIKNQKVSFIDIDKTIGSTESFASEILLELTDDVQNARKAISSLDTYVISSEILAVVKRITSKNPLILIVTLNLKASSIQEEIDTLLVQIQKSKSIHPVSILWSVDTSVFRMFKPAHSSSSFFDNVYYYPTFDEVETKHSLTRISKLKGKSLKNSHYMEETGGIAGLFHYYLNDRSQSQQRIEKVLRDIKKEIGLVDFSEKLVSSDKLYVLVNNARQSHVYENIKLKNTPKAQDIKLIEILSKNVGKPVSRDEIAKNLWGEKWRNRYSDWALDKAIERLRKNIDTPEYKIITVRNVGYQLIKL